MADWFTLGAGAFSALANLGGGLIGSSGQQAANAANFANQQRMFDQEQAFNLGQNEEARRLQNEQFYNNLTFQSGQAERQMEFQSSMFDRATELQNTAYQRATRDMRAAGLNPILAYKQGGAGSTAPMSGAAGSGGGGSPPVGGAPSVKPTSILNDKDSLGRAIGNAATTAVQAYKDTETAELIKAQQNTEDLRAKNVAMDTRLKHYQGELSSCDSEVRDHDIDTARWRAKTAEQEYRAAHGTADNIDRYGKREAPDTIERALRTIQGWWEQSGHSGPSPVETIRGRLQKPLE